MKLGIEKKIQKHASFPYSSVAPSIFLIAVPELTQMMLKIF